MRAVAAVPREAHALSLFRVTSNGEARSYSAVTFPRDPYAGCERMVRMAAHIGAVADASPESYAVLDVLDANGDIIADYGVTSAKHFQWLKKKLGLVVESPDAGAGS